MNEFLTDIRRALHRIPETGFDVQETREYVLRHLKKTRAEISDAAGTGILAYFDFGRDHAIGFRADMDGLDAEEPLGCGYESLHPGKMHACGHDAHMAMLIGLAYEIDKMKEARANVLLVFQPAEESGGGGGVIVKEGALSRYNLREVYAIHVDPMLPLGVVASRPGPMMAMATETHVTAHGRAAHIAKWRDGVDGLYAMTRLLSRAYDAEEALPQDVPRLMRFGRIQGGSAVNILADEVKIGGSIRAYDRGVYETLRNALLSAAKEVEEATGAEFEFQFLEGYPAVRNDEALFLRTKRAVPDLYTLPEPSLLAEDFGFYTDAVPGVMMFLGLGTGKALHSAQFRVDDEALEVGVSAFLKILQA